MVRSVAGAALGVAMAALLVMLDARVAPAWPLHLFAPLGATAVLVFAVPLSPLAQPYACVVGNMVSAAWASAVVAFAPEAFWPPVAVGGAIACMWLTRSLHPPGGAMALLVALSPPSITPASWWLLELQTGVLTAVLVLTGVVFHRLTGGRYPLHTQAGTATPVVQQGSRLGLGRAELAALLQRAGQSANLDAEALAELIAAAEDQAIAQRLGGVHCGQLMHAAPLTCQPQERLLALAERFAAHPVKSLPVVDAQGRLLGLLERNALHEALWQQAWKAQALLAGDARRSPRRWWSAWRRHAPEAGSAPTLDRLMLAEQPALMQPAALSVDVRTPVGQLLATLARHQVPCVPVHEGGVLVGVITRTDVLRLLLQPQMQ